MAGVFVEGGGLDFVRPLCEGEAQGMNNEMAEAFRKLINARYLYGQPLKDSELSLGFGVYDLSQKEYDECKRSGVRTWWDDKFLYLIVSAGWPGGFSIKGYEKRRFPLEVVEKMLVLGVPPE